jgi:hypothetical protein
MSLVLVNQGEQRMLEQFLNAEAHTLRLYSNDKTPGETDTEAGYTEVTDGGYASKVLAVSGWTVTPGAPTEGTYAQQIWTFTGSVGNVYGYFVTRDADSKLQWAERFTDGPYNIQNNGDQIKVTPKFTQD